MSASHTTQPDLSHEVDALVAALMGDAQPAEVTSLVDRLEAVLAQGRDVPAAVISEVRSAIELVRGGQPCAAVSALLAARSELSVMPGSDAS
ncbi:MAG TPA: hypothetical protein VNA67_01350 [Pseudonocardiaceae bacterium]|nr:hypothetical protein [Pseudonocardiaceae bacterium]